MKIIGITGGIGSGKSTVCRIFMSLGIPVFDSDSEGKAVYQDEALKKKITALLGSEVYKGDVLDRSAVAKKVFTDKSLLGGLNAIIHPAVQQRFAGWCRSHTGAPYVIKEAAILFESGTDKDTDAVITVVAPKELKIARVMERSKLSAAEVEKRMQSQWSDEEKIKRSTYVVHNDERQLLIPQVLKIHEEILTSR